MTSDYNYLYTKIVILQTRLINLADFLQSAFTYLPSDPHSSLTKCRIILEKILKSIYVYELGKEPSYTMIGQILSDKPFTSKMPKRILARMNFIREMANLGSHGGEVNRGDAIRVLHDLVDVLDWYVLNYDLLAFENQSREKPQTLEIFPQLKSKFPSYIRPDITSVKLGQIASRSYLEITSVEPSGDYLYDETIKRIDLAFITDGDEIEGIFPYFNPSDSITENAYKFIHEFSEISIINCTDLFTDEAASEVYELYKHTIWHPNSFNS